MHPSSARCGTQSVSGANKVSASRRGLGVAPIFPLPAFQENGAYVIACSDSAQDLSSDGQFKPVRQLIVATDYARAESRARHRSIKRAIEMHSDVDECVAIGPPV